MESTNNRRRSTAAKSSADSAQVAMEGWSFAKVTAMTMGFLAKFAEQAIEDT